MCSMMMKRHSSNSMSATFIVEQMFDIQGFIEKYPIDQDSI